MSQPQPSNIIYPCYKDGKWYCGCGLEVNWLKVTKEERRGETFLRCPRPRDRQCKFFLWEKEESASRDKYSPHPPSTIPPSPRLSSPQTPTRKNNISPIGLQTPDSRGTTLFGDTGRGSAARASFRAFPDSSPTPSRFQKDMFFQEDAESDLATKVLNVLQDDKLVIRFATAVQLRHIIDLEMGIQETKLQRAEQTIKELYEKLNELENAHIHTGNTA